MQLGKAGSPRSFPTRCGGVFPMARFHVDNVDMCGFSVDTLLKNSEACASAFRFLQVHALQEDYKSAIDVYTEAWIPRDFETGMSVSSWRGLDYTFWCFYPGAGVFTGACRAPYNSGDPIFAVSWQNESIKVQFLLHILLHNLPERLDS